MTDLGVLLSHADGPLLRHAKFLGESWVVEQMLSRLDSGPGEPSELFLFGRGRREHAVAIPAKDELLLNRLAQCVVGTRIPALLRFHLGLEGRRFLVTDLLRLAQFRSVIVEGGLEIFRIL